MPSQPARPKWWQLYFSLPLLLVLFSIDNRLKISAHGHQIVQVVIVLVVFGFVHLWLKANSSALAHMDQAHYGGMVRVIRISAPPLAETDQHPLLQLPDSEIKGMLSDTFEMDFIDVESIPVDEVSHELNKE